MILWPSLKFSIMESLAAVNAGCSSELLWSMSMESALNAESALCMESLTMRSESCTARNESDIAVRAVSAAAISVRLPRLPLLEGRPF